MRITKPFNSLRCVAVFTLLSRCQHGRNNDLWRGVLKLGSTHFGCCFAIFFFFKIFMVMLIVCALSANKKKRRKIICKICGKQERQINVIFYTVNKSITSVRCTSLMCNSSVRCTYSTYTEDSHQFLHICRRSDIV